MSKHTPGPWVAGLPADGGRINVYSNETITFRVCRVDSDRDFGDHARANATLIAEAPRMLDLLQRFADLMDGEQGTSEYCNGMEALRYDVGQVLQQHGRGQG